MERHPAPGPAHALRRPWLFLVGASGAILSLLGLQEEPHWAWLAFGALGAACAVLSFGGPPLAVEVRRPAEPAPGGRAPLDLRAHLLELDQLLADGLVSDAEHRRKRRALLDSWGAA